MDRGEQGLLERTFRREGSRRQQVRYAELTIKAGGPCGLLVKERVLGLGKTTAGSELAAGLHPTSLMKKTTLGGRTGGGSCRGGWARMHRCFGWWRLTRRSADRRIGWGSD